jgi:hypothetical protein
VENVYFEIPSTLNEEFDELKETLKENPKN